MIEGMAFQLGYFAVNSSVLFFQELADVNIVRNIITLEGKSFCLILFTAEIPEKGLYL